MRPLTVEWRGLGVLAGEEKVVAGVLYFGFVILAETLTKLLIAICVSF